MKARKNCIVTTTINVPEFLDGAFENADRHGRNLVAIVIGDVKTPPEARDYCASLGKRYRCGGAYYLDLDAQNSVFGGHEKFLDIFPPNDAARKMVGTMLAYALGAETVIMMDDDNYVRDMEVDFVGAHGIVGSTVEVPCVRTECGWFNVYQAVEERENIPFFPRAFPWSARTRESMAGKMERREIRIVANQGLVKGDPDIDAISRLFWPIEVLGMRSDYEPAFALELGTWAPLNDQNTAITRNLLPIYFKPPSTGRNADIWTSYLVVKLAQRNGDTVSFGHPMVEQIRNKHDLWKDLEIEALNDQATDIFVKLLRNVEIESDGYFPGLKELVEKMSREICYLEFEAEDSSGHYQFPGEKERRAKFEAMKEMIAGFWSDYGRWIGAVEDAMDVDVSPDGLLSVSASE